MKKAALLLGLFVLAVFFVGGCLKPLNKAATVYHVFPGVNGEANSYILANGDKAAVIDPSLSAGDAIVRKLRQTELELQYIILTHGHFDHIGGIDAVKQEFPAALVLINSRDLDKLKDPQKNLSAEFGFRAAVASQASSIANGQRLSLGDTGITVISTPGHTPGSICLYVDELLFSGDTLFKNAVGRTDFPGGSAEELQKSLRNLEKFSDTTRVFPGHGDTTTLGDEQKNNPFLNE